MEPTDYDAHYDYISDRADQFAQLLKEQPARATQLALEAGGEQALQAMFDALLDQGHRKVLVNTLNSPALADAVRQQLEKLLYGSLPRLAALLVKKLD